MPHTHTFGLGSSAGPCDQPVCALASCTMKRRLQVPLDTVLHEGYHYSTLDFVGPDASCYEETLASSLKIWRKLPDGWDIPVYDQGIVQMVVAKHHWSCDSVLLRSDTDSWRAHAAGTLKHARPGERIYTDFLDSRNGSWRVDRSEKSRILIRKQAENDLVIADQLGEKLWKK